MLNGAEIQRDKEVLPVFTLPSLPVTWVREDGLGSLLKNSVFPENRYLISGERSEPLYDMFLYIWTRYFSI